MESESPHLALDVNTGFVRESVSNLDDIIATTPEIGLLMHL